MLTDAQADDLDIYRRRVSNEFTASADAIAFSVILAKDTSGLAVIDRKTGRQRLIADNKVILVGPRFSEDGQRLLFVRRPADGEDRELVSCETSSWRCRVLLRTTNTVMYPVEIDRDTILYASSPVRVDPTIRPPARRVRTDDHDFYLLKDGAPPRRLSNFSFYQLYALNVTPTQVIFSAAGPSPDNPIIPKLEPLAPAFSEIFALDFDLSNYRIQPPSQMLTPLFVIPGHSGSPSTSTDGQYVAFRNRRSTRGKSRFNLVLARQDGTILKYIETEGVEFSRAAFVGKQFLARELLDDRYRVTEFDLPDAASRVVLELNHSVRSLQALERIQIQNVN